jgi:hypothetical protein
MIVSDLIIWNSEMIKRKATPITKTRKWEDTKEEGFIDSLALFRAFVLSCFRDGVFFCLLTTVSCILCFNADRFSDARLLSRNLQLGQSGG